MRFAPAFLLFCFSVSCFSSEKKTACFAVLVGDNLRVNLDVTSQLLNIPKENLQEIIGVDGTLDPRQVMLRQILVRVDEMRQSCSYATVCQISLAVTMVRETINRVIADGGLTSEMSPQQLLIFTRLYDTLISGVRPSLNVVTEPDQDPRLLLTETSRYQTFRQWLEARMAAEGIRTQTELAERMGRSVRAISGDMIRKSGTVGHVALVRYSKFFGYTVDSVRAAIASFSQSTD